MQINAATPEQVEQIKHLLSQNPQMGLGVNNLAYGIATYDGNSAIRYMHFMIATHHSKEKMASLNVINC
jgi:hypothetical protein